MKIERLFDAIAQIDEEFIEEADPEKKHEQKKKVQVKNLIKIGALAACMVIIVGISLPYFFSKNEGISGGAPEEPELEGNYDTTSDGKVQDEAGEEELDYVTLTHMVEIKVKIDEMFPDGFRGTIEVGTDLFKVGEQITIVAQDNVTVVQKDGSIFDYDELEPNIKESDLAVGNSVWVGFQKYEYTEGNGKYNQIFAYHVVERDDSIATDNEPMVELTLEEAVSDAKFGNLFPAAILDGYVLQDAVAVLNDSVLIANFYNKALGDELTLRIASQEWFYNQKKDLVQNTVMYREKDGASYIYIAGGENIVQYTFSKTDIADNEQFYDMVYSASYFSECIDYPDIEANE